MYQETSGFITVFQIHPDMFRQVVAIFRGSCGRIRITWPVVVELATLDGT
jgi:hypothetical protein